MTNPHASYFPRWALREEGVIAPDERLPLGATIALGIQHVVAMFGATVLAPLLMGFDPNVAILFSGVGTLIFFVAVGGRVPSYLGSSFSFIAVVIAATGYAGSGPNANLPLALGGIIAAGVKFGAMIMTIPGSVLGGLAVIVFGLITATGARIGVQNGVDFANARNLVTVAATLTIGAGDLALKIGGFTLGGIGDVRGDYAVSALERRSRGMRTLRS